MFMNRLWAVNRNNTQKGNLHNKDRIMGDFFLFCKVLFEYIYCHYCFNFFVLL